MPFRLTFAQVFMAVNSNPKSVDFSNTEIAFSHLQISDLKKAHLLFSTFKYPILVKYGPKLAALCLNLGLPIKGILKKTIFNHFCGGENILDCNTKIDFLYHHQVHTILDYSVEGEETEVVFNATCEEIIQTIHASAANPSAIPFAVFKVTGIGRFEILRKVNNNESLNASEQAEFDRLRARVEKICRTGYDNNVRVLIDAEETWIQDTIDSLVLQMSALFNTHKPMIYNTVQMYRHDRLDFVKKCFSDFSFYLGFKIVRGAYMEKEKLRAEEMHYGNPIQATKENTDTDYNDAVNFCLQNIERCAVVIGTHNEKSCVLAMQHMQDLNIDPQNPNVYFSQLLGMSDNISFNLAKSGYLVAKYVPYGPIKAVLPYLGRRAEENSSVKGQTGRELALIEKELLRRKKGN